MNGNSNGGGDPQPSIVLTTPEGDRFELLDPLSESDFVVDLERYVSLDDYGDGDVNICSRMGSGSIVTGEDNAGNDSSNRGGSNLDDVENIDWGRELEEVRSIVFEDDEESGSGHISG